jgi:methylated-DNA-[protein]-cysteine S-methyltransferase
MMDDSMGPAGHGIADLPAPVGRTWALWTSDGLVRLCPHGAVPRAHAREAVALAAGVDPDAERPVPARVLEVLDAFARGEPVDPTTLPVALAGSRYFVAVWRASRRIPRGEVRSYAELAAMAGSPRAIRAVGTAMAQCPIAIVVPCHRVIAAGRKLGGYGGRLDRKRALLALEGWRFDGDRLVAGHSAPQRIAAP